MQKIKDLQISLHKQEEETMKIRNMRCARAKERIEQKWGKWCIVKRIQYRFSDALCIYMRNYDPVIGYWFRQYEFNEKTRVLLDVDIFSDYERNPDDFYQFKRNTFQKIIIAHLDLEARNCRITKLGHYHYGVGKNVRLQWDGTQWKLTDVIRDTNVTVIWSDLKGHTILSISKHVEKNGLHNGKMYIPHKHMLRAIEERFRMNMLVFKLQNSRLFLQQLENWRHSMWNPYQQGVLFMKGMRDCEEFLDGKIATPR